MQKEIIIAGFGGQGVLALGQMLVYGGMSEEKEVSWFPSYGPEMRGGTANCSVVISDKAISSPIVTTPDILIAFNRPSLEKFLPHVKKGGVVIYNMSLIPQFNARRDLAYFGIPANNLAEAAGSVKAVNVALGEVLVAITNVISADAYTFGIKKILPAKLTVIELNMKVREAVQTYLNQNDKESLAG